jgi:hypothetical protein
MTAESMNRWLDEREGLVHVPAERKHHLSLSPGGAGC